MNDFERLAGLELTIDEYVLERRELALPNFTRVTTTIALRGGGEEGHGEDVTYEVDLHDDYPATLPLTSSGTLAELSSKLDDLAEVAVGYRRWGLESAALDLALRQAGRSLGDVLARPYQPVRFVASTRADITPWLELVPALEFKLDAEADWTRELITKLAATDRVRVVDFKAYYEGDWRGELPGAGVYQDVLELLPEAVIEDPGFTDETRELLLANSDRLSFDAPIHSVEDVEALPVAPRVLNIKPSRFGTLRGLFDCLAYCEQREIAMYGGGQFELGVGRGQIQALASLYYADGPNDVAPSAYNEGGARPGLPTSPLQPPARPVGFAWS